MSADVVAFTVEALRQMNFDVDGADRETVFGPAGVDLDSLAVAELALRVEDAYGVKFGEEDMERLAIMTLGEFAADVAARAATLDGAAP
ncbi:phosphopantetheine-binding protein [Phytohabitans kaempferiae]|uniref:Phosphopantetheine-binding protein n=1 Tax=Phytohabitans kaempferiae TaxID=1620943 RepID=A0ABV6M8J2_9ACTN